MSGSGGVDPAGTAAGVGESAVFAGAVVLDLVATDQLLADGDLDVLADDSDLDLASPIGVADPIVRRREALPQRLYPALHLAAHTGMRRGEIVGLKWSDLDTARSRLSISRSIQNVGGKPVEFGVKTRTSRRTVELDHYTRDILVCWRHRLLLEHLPHRADDWMFCNTSGRFLNPESLTQLFDRIVQRNYLPRIRFHDLRHTHASLLVADGIAIKVVSERLGHAHPAFTMHTYQHVLPGMSASAAEQFANLVATASR